MRPNKAYSPATTEQFQREHYERLLSSLLSSPNTPFWVKKVVAQIEKDTSSDVSAWLGVLTSLYSIQARINKGVKK